VGFSSLRAVVGNKIAPGLLDKFLSKFGYDAQQYDGAPEPNAANNLVKPLTSGHSVHGDFDNRAKEYSIQFWITTHRFLSLSILGVFAIGILFVILRV
jgi:hypothetical protein